MSAEQNVSKELEQGERSSENEVATPAPAVPKPHSRQDVKIIRRVLTDGVPMGFSVAVSALANLEQQFQRLEEQLEAAHSALRAFVNAMESADVITVEPSYLGFEVALSMADQALASSPAKERQ